MATKPDSNSTQQEPVEKKQKSTLKYPPYVNAYGAIPKLFSEICKASVPPKFTQDFMETVLELKSSSHRALIPLLKKLNFIDAANIPTEAYKNYRDPDQRRTVMAIQIRASYADVYKANEYAHTLKKEELQSKLRALIGASEDDPVIPPVIGTFMELVKLADFDTTIKKKPSEVLTEEGKHKDEENTQRRRHSVNSMGLS